MNRRSVSKNGFLAAAIALAATSSAAWAQAPVAGPPPANIPAAPPYGPAITYEQAMKVLAAAEAKAQELKARATIAIVDPAGGIVYYQRQPNAPYNAEGLVMKKAIAAARTKRNTSFDANRYSQNPAITSIPDVFPFPGGAPIIAEGKVIGAIGVTGGDDPVAVAGAAALK